MDESICKNKTPEQGSPCTEPNSENSACYVLGWVRGQFTAEETNIILPVTVTKRAVCRIWRVFSLMSSFLASVVRIVPKIFYAHIIPQHLKLCFLHCRNFSYSFLWQRCPSSRVHHIVDVSSKHFFQWKTVTVSCNFFSSHFVLQSNFSLIEPFNLFLPIFLFNRIFQLFPFCYLIDSFNFFSQFVI